MRQFRCIPRLLPVLLLGLVVAVPVLGENAYVSRIEGVIAGQHPDGKWGVLIADGQTGGPLYQRNEDQQFTPASTIKLFFGAAALADLGPDYRFKTPVYRRGTITDGTLDGDLVLVAQGDLTLGGRDDGQGHMAFADDDHTYANTLGAESRAIDTDPLTGLRDLARQVAAAGIREVTGEVFIDDRLFEVSRGSGTGPDLLSPIVVNDNLVDVVLRPGDDAGEPASVRMRPATNFVRVVNRVVTAPAGARTQVRLRELGERRFAVEGQLADDADQVLRVFAVRDPAAFARALFIEALEREGVRVRADADRSPDRRLPSTDSYEGDRPVAVFTSLPFSELLRVTFKTSSNIYANSFPLLMAARHGRRTLEGGLDLLRKKIRELGVDTAPISVATAAGGSVEDRITPRATVQLLRAVAGRPDFAVFRAALPVLGVDGTLADAVRSDSPARGKVRAKTGTFFVPRAENGYPLLRCKALAGYLTTAHDRPLVFAIFLNDAPLPRGTMPKHEGQILGHLCEILYRDLD